MKDAIVIGSGVNELVAAHMLARGGRRVVLIPDRVAEVEAGWVPPALVRELDLERHGLQMRWADPWISAPLPDGGRLELWQDMARSVQAIRAVSTRDAAKWPEFCARMSRLAGFLATLYAELPPDPLNRGVALRARRLGRQALLDLMRFLPMPVADLLDDWFENDALKGILGAAGVMDLQQGPRSGGTAFALLHHHVGSPAGVFRPPRSNVRTVLSKLTGIEIRPDADVARIAVNAGRATGVFLSDGEEIASTLILSGAHPARTLLELVEPGWLDPELARAVSNIRSRAVAARMRFQLVRSPGFSTLVIAPSLDYLERAYDAAKYGEVSKAPLVEAACDERHVLEVRAQYAPRAEQAPRLAELALAMLSAHLDPASAKILSSATIHQPHQAELTLDQALWMRPIPALAGYRTPIEGLYLCGAAMHPGGGIVGAAGYLCARQALRKP